MTLQVKHRCFPNLQPICVSITKRHDFMNQQSMAENPLVKTSLALIEISLQ